MKRGFGWLILLVIMLMPWTAMAGSSEFGTEILPTCYQYVIEGTAEAYCGELAQVYSSPERLSLIGTVYSGQHIRVEQIDRERNMAYIYFIQNDTQKEWKFEIKRQEGWLDLRFILSMYEIENTFVVTNQGNGTRLNLRTKPSKNAVSLGKYYPGTLVRQLEPPKNGYMKVRIGQMVGYMDTQYLRQDVYESSAVLPELTVTNSTCLRKLPQNDSENIKDVPRTQE